MDEVVPKHLNKNKVKMKSLHCPAPVSFVPPSPELPKAKDGKHDINIRINEETEECDSMLHLGILETYLRYCKIYKNIVREKDLHVTFTGYEKEETLASDDLDMHELIKPEANAHVDKVATASRIKRKRIA